jgi:hypothetical protein
MAGSLYALGFAELRDDGNLKQLLEEFNSLAVIFGAPSTRFIEEPYQIVSGTLSRTLNTVSMCTICTAYDDSYIFDSTIHIMTLKLHFCLSTVSRSTSTRSSTTSTSVCRSLVASPLEREGELPLAKVLRQWIRNH